MMRIDKFLSNMGYGTRSEVKKLIKYNTICINDVVCKDPNQKIVEAIDIITINQKVIDYKRFQYFMLNKPKGVITATKDKTQKTVMDLLEKEHLIEYFPVGRLDIDTEGLLLITNDGDMSHRLLSPKKHVDKTYYVECIG